MRAPGSEEAEMLGPVGAMEGALGEGSAMAFAKGSECVDVASGGVPYEAPLPMDSEEEWLEVGTRVTECKEGVGGPDELGETGSVIHIRWDFVATSFATV